MTKTLKTIALCSALSFAPVAVSDNLVETLIAANEPGGAFEGQFDSLITAVVEADLVDELSADTRDGLTVFGPDDKAFAAIGLTPRVISIIPGKLLEEILAYHLVTEAVFASDVVSKPAQTLTMANDERTLVRANDNGAFINRAEITDVDIIADNGVLHVIDKVLLKGVFRND